MLKITDAQRAVLDFVKAKVADDGFPPTRQEIANHFGYKSPNAADDHLKNLEAKGFVQLKSGVSRGIKVLA